MPIYLYIQVYPYLKRMSIKKCWCSVFLQVVHLATNNGINNLSQMNQQASKTFVKSEQYIMVLNEYKASYFTQAIYRGGIVMKATQIAQKEKTPLLGALKNSGLGWSFNITWRPRKESNLRHAV